MIGDTIRKLSALGLTPDQIAGVIDVMAEADDARKSKTRERVRRHRAKGNDEKRDETAGNVTGVTGSFLPLPPTPPNTNLSPVTPYSPPLKVKNPANLPPLAEQLWSLASQTSRDRSGRPPVRKAVTAAIGKGATPDALIALVKARCKGAEDHHKGLHRLIEGEHWREFLAKPAAPAKPPDPEQQAHRLRHLRDTGEWREEWGEKPILSAA